MMCNAAVTSQPGRWISHNACYAKPKSAQIAGKFCTRLSLIAPFRRFSLKGAVGDSIATITVRYTAPNSLLVRRLAVAFDLSGWCPQGHQKGHFWGKKGHLEAVLVSLDPAVVWKGFGN